MTQDVMSLLGVLLGEFPHCAEHAFQLLMGERDPLDELVDFEILGIVGGVEDIGEVP